MPRPDGTPTIAEMICEGMIDDLGKSGTLDAATVIADLKEKLGYVPDASEIAEYLGIDPRAEKPWPPEEDCPGCDLHRDGPHRFTCSAHGVRQIRVIVDRKA